MPSLKSKHGSDLSQATWIKQGLNSLIRVAIARIDQLPKIWRIGLESCHGLHPETLIKKEIDRITDKSTSINQTHRLAYRSQVYWSVLSFDRRC